MKLIAELPSPRLVSRLLPILTPVLVFPSGVDPLSIAHYLVES